jgi:hypothetical protein
VTRGEGGWVGERERGRSLHYASLCFFKCTEGLIAAGAISVDEAVSARCFDAPSAPTSIEHHGGQAVRLSVRSAPPFSSSFIGACPIKRAATAWSTAPAP